MRWQNRLLLLIAFTTAILFSPLGFAQNYFFHLLGVANSQGFVWTGVAGDNDWNNPFNWSTNSVPGVGDVAYFKGASCVGANCNANLSGNISVLGVDIDVGYAGTITQGAGHTITIGASGWTQAGGTFAGGNSNITFTASNLALSGASVFTATTGQTYFNKTTGVAADVISTSAGVTLTFPDLSVQKFHLVGSCTSPYYRLNTANKVSFYNLIVSTATTGCGYAQFGHSTIAVEIRNDFTNATAIPTDPLTYQGIFELFGNMSLAAGDTQRLALWKWKGASNSTFATTGSFGAGAIQIEKTGGATVTPFAGTTQFETAGVYVKTGEFTFPTALAIYKTNNGHEVFRVDTGTTVNVPTNSTLSIFVVGACGGPTYEMNVDSNFNFENVVLTGGNTGCGQSTLSVHSADTVTVKKNLTVGNDHKIEGSWILEGNLVKGPSAVLGGMSLTLNGTAAQALDTVAWGTGPIIVNKASGTASLSANFTVSSAAPAVTVQSGTLSLNAKNLTITNTLTVNAGGKVLCAGGTLSAGSYAITGEVSCGTGVGITWTGAAGDNLWTTAGNWTNNNIPVATDTAIFTGACTGANCNASINTNISTKGIWLTSAYAGTLTQNSTRTITVGTSGWIQTGGTFAGGDSAITMNGTMSLTDGTFISTSGTLYAMWTLTMSGGSTVFTHNSGTFNLAIRSNQSLTAVATGFQFNNFNIYSTNGYLGVRTITGTIDVLGNFACDVSNIVGRATGGDIYIKGNISFLNLGCIGTTAVHAVGTGNQTITGAVGSYGPGLVINSTGGTVSLVDTILITGDFAYTQGTVAAGTSTLSVQISGNETRTFALSSPLTLNNFMIRGYGYNSVRTFSGSDLTVAGNFTCDTTYDVVNNSGTIHVLGDISLLGEGCYGTTLVRAAGSGNQTIAGVSTASGPVLEISSTGGIVTLSGYINLNDEFTYTQGTVAAGTSTVHFHFNGSNFSTVALSAPLTLNNVTFGGYAGNSATRTFSGSPLTVVGTLLMQPSSSGPGTLNGSTIYAKGDISSAGTGVIGTTVLEVSGNSNQTLTGVSAARWPVTVINSTGGTLSLSGTLEFSSNFTYTQGTVDAGTSTVTFMHKSTSSITLVLNAPLALNNVSFTGSGSGSATRTISGNDLTINGLLFCDSSSSVATVNGQALLANGDVNIGSGGCSGTTNLKMVGTASANLTVSSSGTGKTFTGAITIDKTGGAQVAMATDATFSIGQNLLITNGTLDLSGYAISVNTALNVGVGTTLKCSGGTFSSGSLVNSGTILCPGYSTYPFQWTGAGGNSNWNTAGNWQGGVVPGASDVAAFTDTYCTPNCNVTINTAVNIRGLEIVAPYAGTITQGSGNTITVGYRGWKQPDGTFVGSNANITITGAAAKFSLTGTSSFTATSAILSVVGLQSSATTDTIFTVGSSATFNPNGGTVKVSAGANASSNPVFILDAPTLFQFHHLILHQSAASNSNSVAYAPYVGRTLVTAGNLTLGASEFASASGMSKMNGAWQVRGNYIIGTDAKGGTGTVNMNGTGAQTITQSASGVPAGGAFTATVTTGSLTLASNLSLSTASQDFAIASGTFNMAGFNLTVARNISNSGVLRRGTNPSCGTVSQGGTFTGTAAICP